MIRKVVLPRDWQATVRSAIAPVRPDLADGSLRPLGAGLESVAVLLEPAKGADGGGGSESGDGAYVLRFPRTEDGAKGIACETRLLPELAGHLDLPIPQFAFTAPNPLGPGSFCCYPVVPGDSLHEDEWHGRGLLDEPGPVRQIAEVIEAIHAFPVERARELDVPEVDFRREFTESFDLVRAQIVPLLPADEAKLMIAAYERHLGDDANFDYRPALIHGDVSLDHLLVIGTRITGLIDFGDAQIGDPDYDLCYLWPETGSAFVQRLQEHRGRPLTARLEAKLRFWELADPADDVLHAIENDLPDLREDGLDLVRSILKAGGP